MSADKGEPSPDKGREARLVETKRVEMEKPTVLFAVPEAGLVGVIYASYLIEQLGLKEVGYIDSDLLANFVVVHGSLPTSPIRVFASSNLAVVLSEVPIPPKLTTPLAAEIASWFKSKGSNLIIGVTGLPSARRLQSDEEGSEVFGVTNDGELRNHLPQMGFKLLEEGVIMGAHAAMIRECILRGLKNVTVLAEAYPEFPDPAAALATTEMVSNLIGIRVDTSKLKEESEEIRLKMRELMKRTQQSMQEPSRATPRVYT
jgi:uncharacterized protein